MIQAIVNFVGYTFVAAISVLWTFGGFIGAIYWAARGDAWSVLLSMIIPMYGVISVAVDYFG